MRYVQLRAFHNVAIHGGFSRAAEALFLTQPAISDQVRKLEQEYDTLLFNREKRQVSLTTQGRKLLKITKQLFEIENQALELLTQSSAIRSGTLRLHVDSASHVLEVLARFRQKFPKVKIEIHTGNTDQVIAALHEYRADIGVLGAMPNSAALNVVRLGSSPLIAFAAKSSSLAKRQVLTLHDLVNLPLVMREQGSKTRQKLEQAATKQGITLTANITAEGREAVQEIVASGAGIGFVSKQEFATDARLVAIKIAGAPILMPESVITLSERSNALLIKEFITMIDAKSV